MTRICLQLGAVTWLVLMVLTIAPREGIAEDSPSVEENVGATVEHLLALVRESDLTFIRNGKRYDGTEAAEHMRRKYEHFRTRIETPEDFIENAAARSLLSGKPYMVVMPNGERETTRQWLLAALQAYREEQGLAAVEIAGG